MAEPYRPRVRARLADGEVWGVPVKMHWIDAAGQGTPPADLLTSAWRIAAETLPDAMATEGVAEGAAFCILHRGTEGTSLLMAWWAQGGVLFQRVVRATPSQAPFVEAGDRPVVGCVWELEVMDHERRAFVAHMMRAVPDIVGWRAA